MDNKFNSKSKNWDTSRYYKVYEKDGELWIKFIGRIWRGFIPKKSYMVWCVTTYTDNCDKKISDMYDFGFDYQMDKLLENNIEKEVLDIEPEDALWLANQWSKEGIEYLNPYYVKEGNFVVGNYFG